MLAFPPRLTLAALTAVLLAPASAAGQAGRGSVTFAWQWIDNTGHIGTYGTFSPGKQSVTTSVLAEVDFSVTERFAATVAVPYVLARYTGPEPPVSGLPRDTCFCWQQSLQDLSIAGRYSWGGEFWSVTPQVRFIVPTHNYPYQGEAVAGMSLTQVLVGLSAGWKLTSVLPGATIEAGYTFALVEKASETLRANRSLLFASVGYRLTDSLRVQGGALFLHTHGGLTVETVLALPADGRELSDRLLKMRYWHLTGGLWYSIGPTDLFFSVQPYVWGRDTHDGIAYTVGSTWYFDLSKRGS